MTIDLLIPQACDVTELMNNVKLQKQLRCCSLEIKPIDGIKILTSGFSFLGAAMKILLTSRRERAKVVGVASGNLSSFEVEFDGAASIGMVGLVEEHPLLV